MAPNRRDGACRRRRRTASPTRPSPTRGLARGATVGAHLGAAWDAANVCPVTGTGLPGIGNEIAREAAVSRAAAAISVRSRAARGRRARVAGCERRHEARVRYHGSGPAHAPPHAPRGQRRGALARAEQIDGVTYDEFLTLLLAALVLGLVNLASSLLVTLLAIPLIILRWASPTSSSRSGRSLTQLAGVGLRDRRVLDRGRRHDHRRGSSTCRWAGCCEMIAERALVAPERQIRPRDLGRTERADLERLLGGLRLARSSSPRRPRPPRGRSGCE